MLIAESGSTKTAWRLLDKTGLKASFQSPGINPNVLEQEVIEDIFRTAFGSHLASLDLDELHFYGAGIGSDSQKGIIRGILQKILPRTNIYVEHDILAAARSTRRDEGIICILGTGSNSASHRSYELLESLGGHGYIFGDEGSGMDLGKNLIKGILQGDFPDEARQYVEEHKGKTAYDIKISIHHSSKPNVRMAELAQMVGGLIHLPAMQAMVLERFKAFLDATVVRYPNYKNLHVDFVGSVAFFFQKQLEEACASRGAKLGSIVKDPVDNLVQYHLEKML
ncbi:MAG: BadF/BadG/BcrA/BcrD ATPase family protein [Bacteroidia bacterium]